MTRLDSYVWILWVVPSLVVCAVVALFIGLQFMCGNLSWLFPVNDGPIPVENERVMSPGMSIAIKSSDGEVLITAGKGLKRFYTWDGGTRAVEMCPRQERWYGLKGLYSPGGGNHWWPHRGISRCVAQEGELNFSSEDKAATWLSQTPAFKPRLHRNDGLTAWISKQDGTLGADIVQIYINGKKPTHLQGSSDSQISVSGGTSIASTTKAPVDSNELTPDSAHREADRGAAECFYPSFFGMAEDFFNRHQFENALGCYEDAARGKPGAYIYMQEARCLNELGRYESALKACDRVAKFEHDDKELNQIRARAKKGLCEG